MNEEPDLARAGDHGARFIGTTAAISFAEDAGSATIAEIAHKTFGAWSRGAEQAAAKTRRPQGYSRSAYVATVGESIAE